MTDRSAEIYGRYEEELETLLVERGRKQSASYATEYAYETLALAGAAVQKAVAERLHGRTLTASEDPFRSAEELRQGASAVQLPGGRRVAVSRNMLDVLVAQPALVGQRLGPISAAGTRTLGWAIREGTIIAPRALMTVTRTLEQNYMRRAQTLGAREDGRLDVATVVGAMPDNGGAALLHATHPQLQEQADAPLELVRYHARLGKEELDPLRMRLVHLAAVRVELLETTGVSLPVIQRAERRFDQPDQGLLTSNQLWCAGEQPGWSEAVDTVFPRGAVVAGEWRIASLRGFRYQTDLDDRTIGDPAKFIRDVEKGLPSLMIHRLDARRGLEGADDVVRLEGRLIAPNGEAFQAVVVVSYPHSTSVVYLIGADRAAGMGEVDWEALQVGLAPLHGVASVGSSDDQGIGISLPRRHALDISSADLDKSTNFDALRCFSHSITERSHWRPDDPDYGGAMRKAA